jgi:hypothetical protein
LDKRRASSPAAEGAPLRVGRGRNGWSTIGVTKAVKEAIDEVLFDMKKRSYNAVLTELVRLYWVSRLEAEEETSEGA